MALVHENLYRSVDLFQIDFSQYIHTLMDEVARAHSSESIAVTIQMDIAPLAMSVETAVPCALLISELVSNAFKHAFQGRSQGRITISLDRSIPDQVTLKISDDGIGISQSTDLHKPPTLGLELVQMFCKQLKAAFSLNTSDGSTFTIQFPLHPPSHPSQQT